MRIEPISLFGPSRVTYKPKIDPIRQEIQLQKRELQEKKQKGKKAAQKMNLMAKNFADIMVTYDEEAKATGPYYFSFEKET